MSAFREILCFFNSKKSNKVFTRAEYFNFMRFQSSYVIKDSYLDTVRCYLQNAGYLSNTENGVYRKLKPIPLGLTLTKLQDEAYPKTIKKRAESRKLANKYRSQTYGRLA